MAWTRLFGYLKTLPREKALLEITLACCPDIRVISNVFNKPSGAVKTRPTCNKERDGNIVVCTVEDRSLNLLQEVKRLVVVKISAEAKRDVPWTKMTSTW
jgi:hypothetical protein